MITHRFPHSDFDEAFAIAGSGRLGKVILDWTEGLNVDTRRFATSCAAGSTDIREAGLYKREHRDRLAAGRPTCASTAGPRC